LCRTTFHGGSFVTDVEGIEDGRVVADDLGVDGGFVVAVG
jgi:hypothetical protein